MKKLFSMLLAISMMAILSVSAFASFPEEINKSVSGDIVLSSAAIAPRYSEMTFSKSLKTNSWTELYTDNNWLDASISVTNNDDNPGAIYVKIVAQKASGQTQTIGESDSVGVGLTYISPKVASSYSKYTIYIKAVNTSGTYSITFNDI